MTDATTSQVPKGAAHLDDDTFQKTLDESQVPILVDFYADWCGPCKLAAPIIDKLADQLRGRVIISKVNVDDATIAQTYGVMSIPTVIIFGKKDGKVVELDRKIGFGGEDGYRQMLAKVLEDDSILKRPA